MPKNAQNMLNALGSKAWTCGVVMHNYYILLFFEFLWYVAVNFLQESIFRSLIHPCLSQQWKFQWRSGTSFRGRNLALAMRRNMMWWVKSVPCGAPPCAAMRRRLWHLRILKWTSYTLQSKEMWTVFGFLSDGFSAKMWESWVLKALEPSSGSLSRWGKWWGVRCAKSMSCAMSLEWLEVFDCSHCG